MKMRLTYGLFTGFIAVAMIFCFDQSAHAQATLAGQQFQVDDSVDQLEIIAGSARRLKFKYEIPEIMVENPEIIQATPVSPNEILITGLKPGVSTFTVSDPDKNLQMINVEVKVDTRKLEMAFRNYFPNSQVRVHPLQTGVILAGHVARADQVSNIMQVARDFFPTNVVNQLQVNGNQNIAIKVKIYEVSRTKLKQLGIDWSYIGEDFSLVTSASQLISAFGRSLNGAGQEGVVAGGASTAFSVINDNKGFFAAIDALERHDIAKILDQPVLVAQNGRPAEFLSGGEIPIQVAVGLGTNSIEFRAFGTKLDMVPIVHGNGELTLEVRAEVSEVAPELSVGNVPGFRVRRVNTGVKMRAGHTLALAGDYREDYAAEKQGIPGAMSNPVLGPLFRRVQNVRNETELVFLITPRFISDVEASALPALGPGELTDEPSTKELFRDGYLEVPRCKEDCQVPQDGMGPAQMQGGYAPVGMGQYPGAGQGMAVPGPQGMPATGTFQPVSVQGAMPLETGSVAPRKSIMPRFLGTSRRESVVERSADQSFLWPSDSNVR